MRTFSPAQDVVSTIMCCCCHASSVGGDLSAKQSELFAEQASAASAWAIPASSLAPHSYCRRWASFPRLIRTWCRNTGATSLSLVAAGNQVLLLTPASVSLRELAGRLP